MASKAGFCDLCSSQFGLQIPGRAYCDLPDVEIDSDIATVSWMSRAASSTKPFRLKRDHVIGAILVSWRDVHKLKFETAGKTWVLMIIPSRREA